MRPRFLANGIEPYDCETTATQVECFEDRPRAWADHAREHGHRVDAAEQAGNRVTAGGFRRLAGLALHFGSFAHPRPVDAWVAAQRQ